MIKTPTGVWMELVVFGTQHIGTGRRGLDRLRYYSARISSEAHAAIANYVTTGQRHYLNNKPIFIKD